MPAAVMLSEPDQDQVDHYVAALRSAGLRTGYSTVQEARSFCTKVQRAGGWEALSAARQVDAIRKAPAFSSWLMVTSQLTITADVLSRVDLRLGNAARNYRPSTHAWFVAAGQRLGTIPADITLQWNTLAKVTAVTAAPSEHVGPEEFEQARWAIINAYVTRGLPNSGRKHELDPVSWTPDCGVGPLEGVPDGSSVEVFAGVPA